MNTEIFKKMKAILYRPDGTSEFIEPENGKNFKLHELQAIVGGLIQIIPALDKDYICIMNEEGKLINLDYNHNGTIKSGLRRYNDYVVGNMVWCLKNMVK